MLTNGYMISRHQAMKTIANVVKGVLGVALILAIFHGILLMLAGIPYAGIWTLLIFVLAVLQLPVVFVTLPIVIYMFAVKETVPAIVWSVLLLVAGLSDNVLKPILLGKGAVVPMLVIFIGVVGGFQLFHPICGGVLHKMHHQLLHQRLLLS